MTLMPVSWRRRFVHAPVVEIPAVIVAVGSLVFGITILTATDAFWQIRSFRVAFEWFPPQVWGLVLVILGTVVLPLLIHSRRAAAVPIFLLGIVWVSWVVPIALVPDASPSATPAYAMISAFTLSAGFACLVEREGRGHG